MANGDRADWVIGNLIRSLASEYNWPALTQTEREAVSLGTAQLDALVGVYSLPPGPSGEPVTYEITRTGNKLFAELKGLGSYPKYELFPSSATSFFSTTGLNVDFTLDGGRATSLKTGEIRGLLTLSSQRASMILWGLLEWPGPATEVTCLRQAWDAGQ